MSRASEILLGIGLFALAVAPLAAGFILEAPLLLVAGVLAVSGILPVAYKLIRYPSLRRVSAGVVGRRARRRHRLPIGGGMLVSFSGVDGSGKTTHADRLMEAFEDLGTPTVRVWARWRPLLTYPLMGVLYVTIGWRRKDYHRSRILRRVWPYLVLLDQVAFSLWRIWPHLFLGRVVCVDRYLLDHLVELRFDGLFDDRAAALFRRVLPTPEIAFVLDVPIERAMERKGDTGEMLDRLGIDTSVEAYLAERRNLLLEEGEASAACIIDTKRSIDDTHQEVRRRAFDAYFGS